MYVKDIRVVKNHLRAKYKATRREMNPKRKQAMDAEIQSRVLSLRQYAENSLVFTYVSKNIEVDTFAIMRAAWANHKKVAVPRCVPGAVSYTHLRWLPRLNCAIPLCLLKRSRRG